MQNILNPFDRYTGSDRLRTPFFILLYVMLAVLSAWITSLFDLVAGFGFIALPFVFLYLYLLFRQPIIGLYTAVALGFILMGIDRYIQNIPVGMGEDVILTLTYVALFFNKFNEKIDWTPVKKDITLLAIIWFGYFLLELLNPEARSIGAWVSGRGIALYMLLIIPLTLLFIDSNRKLNFFLYLWGFFSILVSLKGIMQNTIGVDPWERAWLNSGAAETHILFGKLRIFSFLSDAGQFGANQAYSALVAIIVATVEKNWRKRLFFILVAILGFYGMVLSGTRGAISVPLAGLMAFIVLRKNLKIMIFGFFLLGSIFIFFKYTTIGQSVYEIRRMRSAFDPKDPSLQVRIENQKKLAVYLSTRPMGGGIGHAGVKAKNFLPNAFLSQVATDSWYVLIWAEQGIVGLILHLFILFYILIKASYKIMFRIRDPILKMKIAALTSGMFGVMVASYGNAVLGSMPTNMLIYTSMALMLNTETLDKDAISNEQALEVSKTINKSTNI